MSAYKKGFRAGYNHSAPLHDRPKWAEDFRRGYADGQDSARQFVSDYADKLKRDGRLELARVAREAVTELDRKDYGLPQASERLRAKMRDMFESLYGHYGLDELSPISFLKDQGYELTTEFTWYKEGVEELWEMQPDELACLCFLVEEFDYGGLHEGRPPEVQEDGWEGNPEE